MICGNRIEAGFFNVLKQDIHVAVHGTNFTLKNPAKNPADCLELKRGQCFTDRHNFPALHIDH